MLLALLSLLVAFAAAEDVIGDNTECRYVSLKGGSEVPWTPESELRCFRIDILPLDKTIGPGEVISVDVEEEEGVHCAGNSTYHVTVPSSEHGLFKLIYVCDGDYRPFCHRVQVAPSTKPDDTATEWAMRRECAYVENGDTASPTRTTSRPTTLITATSSGSHHVSVTTAQTATDGEGGTGIQTATGGEGATGTETASGERTTGAQTETGGEGTTSGTATSNSPSERGSEGGGTARSSDAGSRTQETPEATGTLAVPTTVHSGVPSDVVGPGSGCDCTLCGK